MTQGVRGVRGRVFCGLNAATFGFVLGLYCEGVFDLMGGVECAGCGLTAMRGLHVQGFSVAVSGVAVGVLKCTGCMVYL